MHQKWCFGPQRVRTTGLLAVARVLLSGVTVCFLDRVAAGHGVINMLHAHTWQISGCKILLVRSRMLLTADIEELSRWVTSITLAMPHRQIRLASKYGWHAWSAVWIMISNIRTENDGRCSMWNYSAYRRHRRMKYYQNWLHCSILVLMTPGRETAGKKIALLNTSPKWIRAYYDRTYSDSDFFAHWYGWRL